MMVLLLKSSLNIPIELAHYEFPVGGVRSPFFSNYSDKRLNEIGAYIEIGDSAVYEARVGIFEYIELFYNKIRRHSSINYLSPKDYEQTCVLCRV